MNKPVYDITENTTALITRVLTSTTEISKQNSCQRQKLNQFQIEQKIISYFPKALIWSDLKPLEKNSSIFKNSEA